MSTAVFKPTEKQLGDSNGRPTQNYLNAGFTTKSWLSGGTSNEPLEVGGEKLFQKLACQTCHTDKANARGPSLVGVYGETAILKNGRTVLVDEEYIRESIIDPHAKITAGYRPVMPTFKGQINEVELLQITAYLKSLAKEGNQSQ